MPTLDQSVCAQFAAARNLEWLVANGRGGYAMGTVCGMLTRRYHGLLVAAPRSPEHRFVQLAKLELTVSVAGASFDLSTNDYGRVIHPQGYRWLESFTDEPFPTWRWRVGAAVVEQTLSMTPGRDCTVVRYRLVDGPPTADVELHPLCTARPHHHLTSRDAQKEPRIEAQGDTVTLHWPGDAPPLHLHANGALTLNPDWFYRFKLGVETARGYDDRQDLFRPAVIRATLHRRDAEGLLVAASTSPIDLSAAAAAFRPGERDARRTADTRAAQPLAERAGNDVLLAALLRAAEKFLVGRPDGRSTIIAGYPWFGDWGRDTFIALPGLCLVTGRHAMAAEILKSFAHFVDTGMVPNRFPDAGAVDAAPDYNSVDASLWYIHAIGRYLAYTGDLACVRGLFPAVREILVRYEHGTRHRICMDADGLLAAGEPGVQLTWMDAKIGDWVVTPRSGKPVEVNALWYNALRHAADIAERLDFAHDAEHWRMLAAACRKTFNARFWIADKKYLYDVVDADGRSGADDAALRPNQVLAVSLPHAVLDAARWKDVLTAVRARLLTPLGLRTLSPDDPHYQPRYAGDQRTRDAAYHQGTVWPWLLGPMISATVRANPAARDDARTMLAGLTAHLCDAGLGGVSEVADGEPPHTPGGCPWQAWSVAEPLRALAEDILNIGPESRSAARGEAGRA